MMDKRSVEIQARLKKIATKMEVPLKEVEETFETKYKELTESKAEGNIDKLALNKTMSEYRRQINKQMRTDTFVPKAKAESVIGLLVGGLGFRDLAEEIRRDAKRYIDKNGLESAKDNNYIDGNNRILDQRETIYGKPNPNHLEPLNPKLKVRKNTLIGLFRLNGDKLFKYTTLSTSDNQLALAWTKVKNFIPCQTFGIVKENTKDSMKLNGSKAADTLSVFKAVDENIDVKETILNTTKPMLTPISKVEKHFDTYKDAWDRWIIVRGIVTWINLDKPTPWGAVWMGLIDPESGLEDAAQVRVQIPENVKVDFGEGSEVIVFGRTKELEYKDRETNEVTGKSIIINANGIYAIPGLTTSKESSTTVEDEEEIEGWLS